MVGVIEASEDTVKHLTLQRIK